MAERVGISINAQGINFFKASDTGHGKTGAIKKGSFLGKSIQVQDQKLNKGSLIDFLNHHYLVDKPKLKKDWFFGLLGGDSRKNVKEVFDNYVRDKLKVVKAEPIEVVPIKAPEIKVQAPEIVEGLPKEDLGKDWNFFSHREDVDLEDVQVFAFVEKHSKEAHRKFAGSVINAYYRPGDVVLVEGTPRGQVAEKNLQTKYVNADFLIMGWDIQKYNYFDSNKAIKKSKELKEACESFANKMCPDADQLTMDDKKKIEAHADDFIKELGQYYDFFIKDEKIRQTKKNKALAILKNTSNIKGLQNRTVLNYYLLKAIDEQFFNEKAEALKYKYVTPEVNKMINVDFGKRNGSLSLALDENCKKGRRVFVIGGGLHLFKSSHKSYKSTEGVKKTLKKYPFVIASPKSLEEKQKYKALKIKELNQDYIRIPNPFLVN